MGGSGESFFGRHFWTLFGSIWFGVGLPFLVIGVSMWWQSGLYSQEGVRAAGTVLSRDVVPASGKKSARYTVRYRFHTAEGANHENSEEIDRGLWENLRERGPIDIEYLASNPRSNRVVGQSDSVGPLIFAALGGFFTLAGGGLVVFSLLRAATRRRLIRVGTPAVAVVLASEPTNFSINRVRQWRVRYQYRDLHGLEHEGKSGYMSPEAASKWSPGDGCDVKFDPRRPDKSVWLGG